MASTLPPVRGAAFGFEMSLVSQADTDTFQDNPTLAVGDVKVIKDGVLDDNIDTLPTAIIGLTRVLAVSLSASEMTADRVSVLFHDVAGGEWQDALVTIYTAAQTFDTTDDYIDAEVAAIKTKTDYLPSAAAGATGGVAIVGSAMTLADDAITAAKIATAAIDADAIATDAIGALELASGAASEIATAVWASTSRTLTQSAASIASAVAGATLTIQRGDSLSASFTGLGDIQNRTKLWFTLKRSTAQVDADALLQVEESAGLTIVNGAAYTTVANGSITVSDAVTGALTLAIDETVTGDLPVGADYVYDFQYKTTTAIITLTTGMAVVTADVTRAVT